jgi:hypothetical protein
MEKKIFRNLGGRKINLSAFWHPPRGACLRITNSKYMNLVFYRRGLYFVGKFGYSKLGAKVHTT